MGSEMCIRDRVYSIAVMRFDNSISFHPRREADPNPVVGVGALYKMVSKQHLGGASATKTVSVYFEPGRVFDGGNDFRSFVGPKAMLGRLVSLLSNFLPGFRHNPVDSGWKARVPRVLLVAMPLIKYAVTEDCHRSLRQLEDIICWP